MSRHGDFEKPVGYATLGEALEAALRELRPVGHDPTYPCDLCGRRILWDCPRPKFFKSRTGIGTFCSQRCRDRHEATLP